MAKTAKKKGAEVIAPTPTDTVAALFGELEVGDSLQLVVRTAQVVLPELGATTTETTKSGKVIWEKAKARFSDLDVPLTTYQQYLSKAVKLVDSGINKPAGKYGYYLVAVPALVGHDPGDSWIAETEEKATERVEKEKLIYEVIRAWLQEQDYRAGVTGSGKANGWWGNPDVTGVICDDAFGINNIEVVTVEAKISEKGWKQWFFEAVSHRRFANRSYFAFAFPEELITKISQDLRYYSELYKVGVLVIGMTKELFENLQNGKIKKALTDEDVNIIELYSAPYTPVLPKYQKDFFKRSLKVESYAQLAQWGKSLDDQG
jgi:hypothetical protein